MATNNYFDLADVEAQQNPVSRRRIARDIAEMVNEPYQNTRLVPSQDSTVEACLHLSTGTRIRHVALQFPADYPASDPLISINGRANVDQLLQGEVRCADVLAGLGQEKQSYTIKTLAIHLLSMFNGDYELVKTYDMGYFWMRSEWEDFSCNKCAYPLTDPDEINTDADERFISQPAVLNGPNRSLTIRHLPTELLKYVLEHLEVQDIVRFGQAWDRIERIIEQEGVIRNRELRCFVTKEHFSQSPLGIGIYSAGRRWTEFDLISMAAFRNLGVRTNVYDSDFQCWLPLALSERNWEEAKDEVYWVLCKLSWPCYEADFLGVLAAVMEDQVIMLFTFDETSLDHGLLQPSEKGIESLSFLFHLLLCIAVDKPEYVAKANNMIESFQAHNAILKDMPSPGRILAALLISDVETNINFLPRLFIETITRSVPELLKKHPGLGYQEDDGAASSYRLHHTFTASLASYRTLMLMDVFQRTVRPATHGTTLTDERDALFHRHGFPTSATLANLAAELRRIMAVDSFPRFCNYLGIYRNPNERWLAGMLRQAVLDATIDRGLVPWTLELSHDENLVLRHADEQTSGSPLLWTEGLPPCPDQPTYSEVVHKLQYSLQNT